MSQEERVPMARPVQGIMSADMQVSVEGPDMRYGRRFSIIVAEDALMRIPPLAVEHVARRLGEQVAHSRQREIEAAVDSYLQDRSWAEPIIKEAIRVAIDRFIRDLLAADLDDSGEGQET